MQELTASNETSMRSISGCRGRRLCDRRCSVDRTSCDIGRDRRSSRSKELRIAAMRTSRHSSCGQLQGSVGISVCRGRKTIGSGSSGRLCSVARGGESGWRRHMSSGGSQPNADMITRNGFPGVVNPGWRYPVVVVYTDACKSTRRAGLGIVVSDRGRRRASSAVCPAALQLGFDRRGFIINMIS